MRVTIAEVAQRAQVSKATVSRVLNGKPDVDASTAQRVRKVIDEVRGPGEVVEPELVVGLTTYLWRRRALPNQAKGLPSLKPALGLYVGLGLIAAADARVSFLPSVYLGPDIEIARGFSLSFCTVARRADTLLAEYKPGSVLTGNASAYKGTTIENFRAAATDKPAQVKFEFK